MKFLQFNLGLIFLYFLIYTFFVFIYFICIYFILFTYLFVHFLFVYFINYELINERMNELDQLLRGKSQQMVINWITFKSFSKMHFINLV